MCCTYAYVTPDILAKGWHVSCATMLEITAMFNELSNGASASFLLPYLNNMSLRNVHGSAAFALHWVREVCEDTTPFLQWS